MKTEFCDNARNAAIEHLKLLEPDDLTGMLGILAGELVSRRKESELDLIRCERFHAQDTTNLNRHVAQQKAYTRRLAVCGSLIQLIKINGEEGLIDSILAWINEEPYQ